MALVVLALTLSAASLLLSLGTTLRVQRLPTGYPGTPNSLKLGAPVPLHTFALFMAADPLREFMRGPTFIVFISNDCKPCHRMITAINESRMGFKGALLLMVEPAGMESLRPDARFEAHWMSDEGGVLRKAFGTRATPHTFLVRDNHIVASQVGADSVAAIQAAHI